MNQLEKIKKNPKTYRDAGAFIHPRRRHLTERAMLSLDSFSQISLEGKCASAAEALIKSESVISE